MSDGEVDYFSSAFVSKAESKSKRRFISEEEMEYLRHQVFVEERRVPDHLESDADCTNRYRIREFFRKVGTNHGQCTFSNYRIDEEMEKLGAVGLVSSLRDYGANTRDIYLKGTNIVLIGKPGTGKDHLLMALATHAFKSGLWPQWVNGTTLRDMCRKAIESKDDRPIRDLHKAEILWLSDPVVEGCEANSFQLETLYSIIDHRYRHRIPTWLTMNAASYEAAGKLIGASVIDRLRQGSITLNCKWKSYRSSCD